MRAAISDGTTIEVVVTGPHPIVPRSVLGEAAAMAGRWVVVTDLPGRRPDGEPPPGGVVVTVREVSEAVKDTDGDRVRGAVDRSDLVEAVVPVKLEKALVGEILAATAGDPIDLATVVAGRGGVVAEGLPA